MLSIAATVIALLTTFFFVPVALYLFLRQVLKSSVDNTVLLLFALILAPISIAWLCDNLLLIAPNYNPQVYCSIILAIFFLLAIVGYKQIITLPLFPLASINALGVHDKGVYYVILIASMIIMLLIFFLSFSIPITGNDQLEYLQVIDRIFTAKSSAIYPITDKSQTGGIYAGWTHPPGFIMLQLWNKLFLSSLVSSSSLNRTALYVNKFIAPLYSLWTACLIYTVLNRFGSKLMAICGLLLYLSIPSIFYLSYSNHIDPLRIATFTMALYAPIFLNEELNWRECLFIGCALGFCLFSHSIGILAIPMITLLLLLLLRNQTYKQIATKITIVLGSALFLLSYRYSRNYIEFGVIIGDHSLITELPILELSKATAVMRDINTAYGKIAHGLLKGFTDENLGIIYWLFFLALTNQCLIYFYTPYKSKTLTKIIKAIFNKPIWLATIIPPLLFYGAATLSLLLGMDLIIKNSRYFLTVSPFIIILTLLLFKNYLCAQEISSSTC